MEPEDLTFPSLRKVVYDEGKWPKTAFICEEKLDGESLIIWRGHAYGRRISDVTKRRENKWQQLPPWIQNQAIDEPVHGEIFAKGKTHSDVKSALVAGRERGWDDPVAEALRFVAYRLPRCDASMSVYRVRRQLQKTGFDLPRCLVPNGKWKTTRSITPLTLHPDKVSAAQLIEQAKLFKLEGWVLKPTLVTPKLTWWKLKVTYTYDCVITGSKDGTGMFYGDVGALKVSMCDADGDLVEVASISGMTEEQRYKATRLRNINRLTGRVCEVECNGLASAGRLLHPRFIRWREDKNASECTLDQLEGMK